MIRFLKHDEIDTEQWDHCINTCFNGNLYASSWYLDLVCPDWSALIEDDYRRVMPLPSWQKSSVRYLAQPYFTQQLGVYSIPALNSKVITSFINRIPADFEYIDINLNTYNTPEVPDPRFLLQTNYELDLIPPYEKIQAGYNENLNRNLKKAANQNFTIVRNLKPEVVVDLFRMNRGRSIQNLGDKQYELLLRLVYGLIFRNQCQVWGVVDSKNEVIAGVIWAYSHQKAIFLFSAVSDEGKKFGAMPFLIDAFIAERSGSSLTLDFEGSNDVNLGRFYASFGSSKVSYYRFSRNDLPLPLRVSLNMYRKFRGMFGNN